MKRRYRLEASREIRPQSYMMAGSWHLLDRAEKSEEGRFYDLLGSMLFSAFSLEAYLNYLGQIKLHSWASIERRLGPREKLDLLCELADFSPDFGKRPFQTFIEIFKFRDNVVHSKPEKINRFEDVIRADDETTDDEKRMLDSLKSRWIEKCNLAEAKRFREDVKLMLQELHTIHGLKEYPYGSPESFTYSATGRDILNDDAEE